MIAITVTVVLLQLCLETLVPSDHCIAYRVVDVQILASVLDLTNYIAPDLLDTLAYIQDGTVVFCVAVLRVNELQMPCKIGQAYEVMCCHLMGLHPNRG